MVKQSLLTILFLVLMTLAVAAQKIGEPTLTPTPPTESQQQIINQGIKLHDAKNYAEAIEKYKQVLAENPNCDTGLYELALSYYYNKDFENTLEIGYKLIQYKSKTGILGYGIIANALDDQGKPKEAAEIYKNAIKQLQGDAQYEGHISSLYYNLGLTYFRQKLYKESRDALKEAVPLDFKYPSPNYLLSEVFNGTGYKVPALLAASRLISLEYNTQRTQRAVAVFLSILNSAKKDEKTGNINIFLNMNAPKDEGDFGGIELILGTLTAVKSEKDKNKSEIDIFSDAVDTLISLLEEDQKLKSTFIGKTYIPFMSELKNKGFTKPFSCIILKVNGNQQAEKWILDNNQQMINFVNWSRSYSLPK